KAQAVPKGARHEGGWRYGPSSDDSDLSVTGWQVLALRAAKGVGCDVPAEAIDRAVDYVKNCHQFGGFAYQPGNGVTPTRTGTGILCLEVCGQHHTPEALAAADYLLRRPLQYSDSYFYYGAYYVAVGLFKVGGQHWEQARGQLFATLLENQMPNGSWFPDNGSERGVGDIYSTSLAVLALAVEYRYLPIYQR
ncbi:MAG: terpene cyclase/mutase family protein, partial [Planctomycetes bacterium]|nr:terpene cyclase/mutase family protein [Planctomycetota bacterium]